MEKNIFIKNQKETHKTNVAVQPIVQNGGAKEKKQAKRNFVTALLIAMLLVCIGVAVYCGIMHFSVVSEISRNTNFALYSGILTNEEQEQWENTPVKRGEAYLQLNLEIPVENDTATIRLINPPYSNFGCQVKFSLSNNPDILFATPTIYPGTVIMNVPLQQSLPVGTHSAQARYVFYDNKLEVQGEYMVDVELVVE